MTVGLCELVNIKAFNKHVYPWSLSTRGAVGVAVFPYLKYLLELDVGLQGRSNYPVSLLPGTQFLSAVVNIRSLEMSRN